jgi:hypothetical protein
MRTFAILIALLFSASADAKPKMKGELTCGSYGKFLGTGKAGKLSEQVTCTLQIADPNGYDVHLKTVRAGKVIKEIDGHIHGEGSDKPFQAILEPKVAFKPCEDFQIVVWIDTPEAEYKKTIDVVQGCPKPKPIKADFTCSTTAGDGKLLEFPKVKKLRGRLEQSIDCTIHSTQVPGGVELTASIGVKGKTTKTGGFFDNAATKNWSFGASLEQGTDYDSCALKFTVLGSLVDADGNERWTGKLVIPDQYCPD